MCTGMDAYGIDTASSMGTAHTPGDTGAESAWADIGAPLSRNYKGFLVIPQGRGACHAKQRDGSPFKTCYYRRIREDGTLEEV